MPSTKPPLSFWQIWNMSFGFLGIQFGWNLQMSNMSAIYEYLGAQPDQLPLLWLAAPLTGLLIQPIIGHMSDNTWNLLGRRKPYFLAGAILSSLALIAMPNSSSLWMAAGLLWILDASINISMEPFRAFVGDMLPEQQRTRGFAMQSMFIGLGATIASYLPLMFTKIFGVTKTAPGSIPDAVRWSFFVGAGAFLCAVLYTIARTKEYPPDATAPKSEVSPALVSEVLDALRHMPATMRQLALVQFATWLGLFCMWLYFPVAVARNVFGATDEHSVLYQEGAAFGGSLFGFYSIICFLFSWALPYLSGRFGRRITHSLCLMCGAIGLISISFIHDKNMLYFSMTGVGIAWASILSMPYAMLAGCLPPNRMGLYVGIFNFFIVLPEILAATTFGFVMNNLLDNNRTAAVVMGGCFLMIASLLVVRVQEREYQRETKLAVAGA